MSVFYTIIQKHCNANNIFFLDKVVDNINDKSSNNKNNIIEFWQHANKYELTIERITFIKSVFYYWFINKVHFLYRRSFYINRYPKAKLDVLDRVLRNIFYTDAQKEEILNTFAKVQRTYNAFSRFAFLYKMKKAKMQITTDLGLNPIDACKSNVIQIYQNKSNYLFIIQDLVNIIETCLSNSTNFFSDPLPIKNPYNNVCFSIAILHHIYFFIKQRNYIMPQLFHLYFLENFNLKKFSLNNESTIREVAIKNYVFNTPPSFLYVASMCILRDNDYTKRFKINEDFPKDKLVNIMRPYLYLDYVSNMSLNMDKRHECAILLHQQLQLFYSFNPQFGRKQINAKTHVTTFNDKHIDVKINSIKRRWSPDSDSEDGSDWVLLANVEDNSHLHREDDFPFNVVSGPQQNPNSSNYISDSSRSSGSSITITSENDDLNNSDDEFYFGTPIANSFI